MCMTAHTRHNTVIITTPIRKKDKESPDNRHFMYPPEPLCGSATCHMSVKLHSPPSGEYLQTNPGSLFCHTRICVSFLLTVIAASITLVVLPLPALSCRLQH